MDECALPSGLVGLEQLRVEPNSEPQHLYTAAPHTADDEKLVGPGNKARV